MQFCNDKGGESRGRGRGEKMEIVEGREMGMYEK